jgi:hypothetical protein
MRITQDNDTQDNAEREMGLTPGTRQWPVVPR